MSSTVIKSPTVGFLNLLGAEGTRLLSEDQQAVSDLFMNSWQRTEGPLACDVLFIYCRIDETGNISATTETLRELIRHSRAKIVVVASEHPIEHYVAATKSQQNIRANLVMTLERRGALFSRFFRELFQEMQRGVSMPLAWAKLAPQYPGTAHDNLPSTIFSAEIGQVFFK